MGDIAELGIKVNSKDILKATKRLDKLELQSKQNVKQNKKLSKSFSGLGTTIGSLGLGLAFKSIISLAIEQERVVKQLDAAIKSTGGSAGFTTEELQKMAASLQNVTTFGDEAIIAAQGILLSFKNLKDDTFPQTTEAVLDLAERMGTDLKSAAVQLGKALNAPVQNLSALSRAGIQFNDSQKSTIKLLWETGRQAEAQKIILKELSEEFGGSARAARDTFGGALKSLGNAFGDLLEGDGGNLNDAKIATEGLVSVLQSEGTKKAFSGVITGVIDLTAALLNGVVSLNSFGTSLGANLANLFAGVDSPIVKLKEDIEILELVQSRAVMGSDAWSNTTDKLTKSYIELKRLKDELGIVPGKKIGAVSAIVEVDPSIAKEAALDDEFNAASAHTDRMVRLMEMETDAKAKQTALQDGISRNKLSVTKGILGNLSTLMSSSSKKEFETGKKFAIASALIKGYEAVTSSYAAGAKIGGPVLGAVYAATAAYATKIQVDNIKSQSFGGGGGISVSGGAGGGVSSGANLGGGAPSQTSQPTGGTTTVNLLGNDADTFTRTQVDNMFDSISEAIERGDKILFTKNARQALEGAL